MRVEEWNETTWTEGDGGSVIEEDVGEQGMEKACVVIDGTR